MQNGLRWVGLVNSVALLIIEWESEHAIEGEAVS